MNDPILGKALPVMQANFPDAPVTKTQAGHFLQEEVAAEIASAITRVYLRLESEGGFNSDLLICCLHESGSWHESFKVDGRCLRFLRFIRDGF